MSKFDLKGANITAKNIHVGDIYNYSSAEDFIKSQSSLEFSKDEKEFVDIIFKNTSDIERSSILESLKTIKSPVFSIKEKKNSIFNFKPLISSLKKSGNNIALKLTTNILTKYATESNLLEKLGDLFS